MMQKLVMRRWGLFARVSRHALLALAAASGFPADCARAQESGGSSDTAARIAGAEEALADEIRNLFRDAHAQYRMKNHAEAERLFADCYALYQASKEHLSAPEKLAPMVRECERYFETLAVIRKREAMIGKWQARLTAQRLNSFSVKDTGLSETLEYYRQRVAKAFGEEPPNFVFQGEKSKLARTVTLDLQDVSALVVLNELAQQVGWEVRFERAAIVFAEKAKVQ